MNEIHDLLERIDIPPVDVAADIARGERGLRRRRRWQLSGLAASAAAVAVLVGVAPSGHGQARSPLPDVADNGGGTALPSPDSNGIPSARHYVENLDRIQQTIDHYRDVLAEHLDATGHDLGRADSRQLGSFHGGPTVDHLGTKLDWRGGGMLQISVSTSWETSYWNAYGMGGHHLEYRGHDARVTTDPGFIAVAVEHDDGQVVEVDASRTFGNNGTSIPSTGLTAQQLLEAAADPRLTLPDNLDNPD
jgi:hypothetical protein